MLILCQFNQIFTYFKKQVAMIKYFIYLFIFYSKCGLSPLQIMFFLLYLAGEEYLLFLVSILPLFSWFLFSYLSPSFLSPIFRHSIPTDFFFLFWRPNPGMAFSVNFMCLGILPRKYPSALHACSTHISQKRSLCPPKTGIQTDVTTRAGLKANKLFNISVLW